MVHTGQKLARSLTGLAIVVAVGACSSSSKGPAATSSTTATPTGTAASSAPESGQAGGAPIKVGIICTCSGPFGSDILDAEDAYRAWADSVNAAGGLAGHPVQLTMKDDAGTPGTSATDLAALVSDRVDAIVDLSIVDQTWASTVQAANIPVVGADETETPFYQNPDFYPEGQTNDSVTYANVATAKAAGATNLGDLYCAEAPSCAEGVGPIKAAGSRLGIPDVYNGEIAATAPDYTAQCLAAKQDHVSAIFIGDENFVIQKVATDCAQQGYQPIYLTEGEGFGLGMASTVGLKDRLWSEYSQEPFFASTPAIQTMNAAVDKYFPGIRGNNAVWTQIAAEGWASGLLLADAVKGSGLTASGNPTPAGIVTGLESLKGDDLEGMAPPLTFPAGKDHPIDCWFTARVVNGTPTVVDGGHVTCENGASS